MRTRALVIALTIVAAACGGSDADSGVASIEDVATSSASEVDSTQPPEDTQSDEDSVLEFAACMRDRNIDFIGLGHDCHGCRRGMDAALRFGLGHSLNSMNTALEAHLAVYILAMH